MISAVFPEATPESTGILTGTVIDAEGRPIAGANVAICFMEGQGGSISVEKEHAVRTDAQGRYVVQAIPRQWPEGKPTKLRVIVYKDGYVGVESEPCVFQPGDNGTQVGDPIRLEPGVSLSGTVVDPEGRPVVGASVEVAGSWSQGTRTYKTGPAGRFTVPNLNKGVTQLAFRFGTLVASGYYIAGGKGEDLVQLRRAVASEPAATAKTALAQR